MPLPAPPKLSATGLFWWGIALAAGGMLISWGWFAMANAGPDTNGSQFFFVYADTDLPPAYTVFGHLDEASNQVIADIAYQGHDTSNPDGTGVPYADTTIGSVVSG